MKRILGRLSPYRTIERTKEKRNEACFFHGKCRPSSVALLAHISSLLFLRRSSSTTFFSLAEHLLHEALIAQCTRKSYNKHNHSSSSHCHPTTKLPLARLSPARNPRNIASHIQPCRPRTQTRGRPELCRTDESVKAGPLQDPEEAR
jgi:hypothetical protein